MHSLHVGNEKIKIIIIKIMSRNDNQTSSYRQRFLIWLKIVIENPKKEKKVNVRLEK